MTGISAGAAQAIARQFPWARYRTFADLGTAEGCLPVQVALAHPHLSGVGFDLPPLGPIVDDYAAGFGLGHRLRFRGGDFFADPLPEADVLVLGRVLHDWGVDERRALLARAYAALPAGGAVVVYEAILDDERRENAFGLLMSLNMLIETPAAPTTPAPSAPRGCARRASARPMPSTCSAPTRWSSASSSPAPPTAGCRR